MSPPPLQSSLASMAWPVSLGMMGIVLLGVVDTLIVAPLGEEALAAVGLAHTWSMAGLVVGLGVANGLDPLFAQAFGRGDAASAGAALRRGLALLTGLAVPIMILHGLAEPALRLLGQPAAVTGLAGRYCELLIAAVPPLLWFVALRQLLQGEADMRVATWTVALGNVLNLAADLALVHGPIGLPALGVSGVAISTALTRWCMLAGLIWARRDRLGELWRAGRQAASPSLGAVARLTLPVGLTTASELWAFNVATLIAGWAGTEALASHTILMNVSSTAFMIPLGIGAAAATRVGQQIGAGRPWAQEGWAALQLGGGVAAAVSLLIVLLPRVIAGGPLDAEAVAALTAAALPLVAIHHLFDGLHAASMGVLRGLGDAVAPTIITLVGYGCVGLPLGAFLTLERGWGLMGLWAGLILGVVTIAGLLMARIAVRALGLLPTARLNASIHAGPGASAADCA